MRVLREKLYICGIFIERDLAAPGGLIDGGSSASSGGSSGRSSGGSSSLGIIGGSDKVRARCN